MATLPTTLAQTASLAQGLSNLSPVALIALVAIVAMITGAAIACRALDAVTKAKGV